MVVPEYNPSSDETLEKLEWLVKTAINYSPARKARVTVQSLRFDREKEFGIIAKELRDKRSMQDFLLSRGIIDWLACLIYPGMVYKKSTL